MQKALLPLKDDNLDGAVNSVGHLEAVNDLYDEHGLNDGFGYKVGDLCRSLNPQDVPVTADGQGLIDALLAARPTGLEATRRALVAICR